MKYKFTELKKLFFCISETFLVTHSSALLAFEMARPVDDDHHVENDPEMGSSMC